MRRRVCVFGLVVILGTSECVRADQVLLTFGKETDLAAIEAHDAKTAMRGDRLEVATGHKQAWPGITLKAPGGRGLLPGR